MSGAINMGSVTEEAYNAEQEQISLRHTHGEHFSDLC